MKYNTIIVGAGAAGLLAMKDLLEAGQRVCLLEAAETAGGRMATIAENTFPTPVETGAEFVHGKLPLSLSLLQEANIEYIPVEGKMIAVHNGNWQHEEAHDEHWEAFMRQLGKLQQDQTILSFLDEYFPLPEYADLRASVTRFAEGFDLADSSKASAIAAQREWQHEEETQYRLPGGYVQLVDYLLAPGKNQSCSIHYNAIVSSVAYSKGGVTVVTRDRQQFEADNIVITVSAGILQSGSIEFIPALPSSYATAIEQLGFGDVIKILLQFDQPFWKTYAKDIGFLLSNEIIPTWWTQLPIENNLLTGWLGGPKATQLSAAPASAILQQALQSLSNIFKLPVSELERALTGYKINCWRNHAFIKGGYSYVTIAAAAAKKILSYPVEGRLFFAGEAFYRGESQGTVEAALQSGRQAASLIKEAMRV